MTCQNDKCTSLINVVAKIFVRYFWIVFHLCEIVTHDQNRCGFRRDRCCVDWMSTMHRVLEHHYMFYHWFSCCFSPSPHGNWQQLLTSYLSSQGPHRPIIRPPPYAKWRVLQTLYLVLSETRLLTFFNSVPLCRGLCNELRGNRPPRHLAYSNSLHHESGASGWCCSARWFPNCHAGDCLPNAPLCGRSGPEREPCQYYIFLGFLGFSFQEAVHQRPENSNFLYPNS